MAWHPTSGARRIQRLCEHHGIRADGRPGDAGWCKHDQHWIQGSSVRQDVRSDQAARLSCAAGWCRNLDVSVTCAKTGHAGHRLSLPGVAGLFASRLKAFHEGLGESGYVEGRNVAIDYQWAEGQYKRLPALAADLVARNVDVIVAPGGAPVALAAKASTTSKTIVFEMGGDPVQLGVVDSLSRPGGNITGVSSLSVEVSPKRLELMHELLPTAAKLAVVANPTSPTANSQLENLRSAAEILGVRLQVLNASSEQGVRTCFLRHRSGIDRRTRLHLRPLLCVSQWAACRARPAIRRARNHPIS